MMDFKLKMICAVCYQAKFTLRELYRMPIKAVVRPLIRNKNKTGSTQPIGSPGQLVVSTRTAIFRLFSAFLPSIFRSP